MMLYSLIIERAWVILLNFCWELGTRINYGQVFQELKAMNYNVALFTMFIFYYTTLIDNV
jgi:hypothetical protein